MIIYIFSYLLLSIFIALFKKAKLEKIIFLFAFIWLLFIIGLRYEIGPDWSAYLEYYERIYPYWESIFETDPGYGAINFIAGWLGGEIYLVNTLSAFIFLFGLFYFIKQLHYPSVALAIANNYLVFVVAMSAVRQSIAIGLTFIAYVLFSKGKVKLSLIFSFLAVLFHKTAIFVTIIILFSFLLENRKHIIRNKKILFTFMLIGSVTSVSYYIFFLPYYQWFIELYTIIIRQMDAVPARTILNSIGGLLILLGVVRLKFGKTLWQTMSIFSIISLLLTPLLTPNVVDRLNFYLYPLQMISFAHIITKIKGKAFKHLIYILIFSAYMFIFTMWLLFSRMREWWVPYKNIIFNLVW